MPEHDPLTVVGSFVGLGLRFGVGVVFGLLAVGALLAGSSGIALFAGSAASIVAIDCAREFVERLRTLSDGIA